MTTNKQLGVLVMLASIAVAAALSMAPDAGIVLDPAVKYALGILSVVLTVAARYIPAPQPPLE